MNDYGASRNGDGGPAGRFGRTLDKGRSATAGGSDGVAGAGPASSQRAALALGQALTGARVSDAGVVARTTVILISVEHELNNGQPGPIAVIRTLPAARLHAV
jgi:hypothetical protein